MGRRGPLPDTPHLRALKTGESAPPPRNPPPAPSRAARTRAKFPAPAWLSADGKTAFRSLLVELEAAWPDTISRLDIPALAIVAEHYAVAQAAAKAMRGKGNNPVAVEDDTAHSGKRRPPSFLVYKEATNAFLQGAKAFGLTLESRMRLELDAPAPLADEDDDDLDDALDG